MATYGKDAKALLKELQSQNERMFMMTMLVMNTGRTEQELETNVFQAQSLAQKHNCNLRRLDFQQENALMSSLPLAYNQIDIHRGLTTSSTAIFVPFTTQELFQTGEEALYYGLNALSNNLIMVDRKKLKNPNGLILGTPGSGKSFSAKREITNAFLVTDDDVIICDPESEYSPLVNKLNGQCIAISPSSSQYINPMDINANYSEEDNPVALKADFILSLCELIVGGKDGLQPVEKTVIDRCVHQIYQNYFNDPKPENMPILEDLYNALLEQEEKEARHVATALEIYVKGSLNLFNHRTNVDIHNRLVCYDIKQLGKEHHLSQEELAELLDVSRQAVSKWEQGNGYPEVEKLLLLSSKLNISLDSLMSTEIAKERSNNANVTGTIVITSPHENVIATCYKVSSSGKMLGGKSSPQYALFGVSNGIASFWGEPTTFLGWYADKEQITKEVEEIQRAIANGIPTYTLKYSAKTERRWAKVKIIEE